MDEEQNQEQQNNQSNGIEDIAKKGVDAGVNLGKQKVKQALRAKIAAAFASAFPVIAIILAICAVIGIATALFKKAIDNDVLDKTSEKVNNMIGDYCMVTEDGIKFDKEALQKEIEEQLASGGIDKEKLGMGLSEKEASEFLYKMMATSMASNLPYIKGSDKEAQGIIYLYRDINRDGVIVEEEELEFVRTNKI